MKSNPWFDSWAKKAKEKGYPARSVFKLMEIQKRFKVLKKGSFVLDLGAAPGSWSKFACEVIGKDGKVIGVDLQDVKVKSKNLVSLKKDASELSEEDFKSFGIEKFDVVLSDMAPKTTGDRFGDHIRSVKLARLALELAEKYLRPGGDFVVKVFEGERLPQLRKEIEKKFKSVKLFKPKSSRKESRETFIIAQGFQRRGKH